MTGQHSTERFRRLREIERMDPERQYHEIWLADLLYEFPWDLDVGYWLAFYNTLTPPADARLLVRSGEMERDAGRRLDQMATLMWEMFRNGFADDRGRAAARQMNRIHRNSVTHLNEAIGNDQYLYVLATTMLTPQRWLDRYGWRPVSPAERRAAVRYFQDFGQHMGLRDIPSTYAEFERFHDAYEAEHVVHTPEAARLWEATRGRLVELLTYRLPPRWRARATPLARRVLPVLLSDAQRRAFGLPAPSRAWRAAVHTALRVRRLRVRYSAPRDQPAKPERIPTLTYPDAGYDVARVGPAHSVPSDAPTGDTAEHWGTDPAEREHRLLELVRAETLAVLGTDAPRSLPRGRPFSALGFTSLSAVELRNRLNRATGMALPATLVFDHPTPEALARHLHERMPEPTADERRVRAALATIPLDRLRDAGLLGPLLELAGPAAVPDPGSAAAPAPGPAGSAAAPAPGPAGPAPDSTGSAKPARGSAAAPADPDPDPEIDDMDAGDLIRMALDDAE